MLLLRSMSAAFTWFGVRHDVLEITTFQKAFCLGLMDFLADATMSFVIFLVLDDALDTIAG